VGSSRDFLGLSEGPESGLGGTFKVLRDGRRYRRCDRRTARAVSRAGSSLIGRFADKLGLTGALWSPLAELKSPRGRR
jgi:hypothetical protein